MWFCFSDELKRAVLDNKEELKDVYARVAGGFPPNVVEQLPLDR